MKLTRILLPLFFVIFLPALVASQGKKDDTTLLVAHGVVDKAGKNSLTIKPRSASFKRRLRLG
jgi:hypothetical protein